MSTSKGLEAHVDVYKHGYPLQMSEFPQGNPGQPPFQGQSRPVIIHAINLGDDPVEMICPHCVSHIR